jgi:5'-3' exonuclease
MGIPKYFKHIVSNFKSLTIPLDGSCEIAIDNLYFDMNCLIHPCVQKVIKAHPNEVKQHMLEEKSEKYISDEFYITNLEVLIYNEIDSYVDTIITRVNPTKLVYLAIDGVASRAKMEQQRLRRYRSIKEKRLKREIYERYSIDIKNQPDFDTNCITPGTIFLYKIGQHIRKYINNKSKEAKYSSLKWILDDCQNKGEGEHKIFQYMKRETQNDINCVYGLDADLIMLSLCSKCSVYLLREHVYYGGGLSEQDYIYFNVDEFKNQLIDKLTGMIQCDTFGCNDEQTEEKTINKENLVLDYIVLGFLIGNDFLPPLLGISLSNTSFSYLLKVYCDIIKNTRNRYLVKDGLINFDFIRSIVNRIYADEPSLLKEYQHNVDNWYPIIRAPRDNKLEMDLEKLKYYPYYNKKQHFKLDQDAWNDRYYLHYFGIRNVLKNKPFINDICQNYIDGLQWNLEYYLNKSPSDSWYYRFPAAPCLRELCMYLSNRVYPTAFNNTISFTPFEQLAIVLPLESGRLIWPKKFGEMAKTDLKLKSFYPIEYDLDTWNKHYLHESNPVLVPIDAIYIKNIFNGIELTEFEKKRNSETGLFIIESRIVETVS